MQGISTAKHQHLVDALLQLERELSRDFKTDLALQQAAEYRTELEAMHRNYERLLDELSRQITEYEILYSHVKIRFLGKKLKELKKEISAEMKDFPVLVQNIHLVYGT